MNYGEIKNFDIANGTGVRVSLFVSGCTNHCKNCFQPQTWDFNYGRPFTQETEEHILSLLVPQYINGFSLLGGEPFEPSNQAVLYPFLLKVKEKYPKKDIWAFSGFTFEELTTSGSYPNCDVTEKMLKNIDILVDGRYDEDLKDISLKFRGSSNQRIIDLNKTFEAGRIVLWEDIDKRG